MWKKVVDGQDKKTTKNFNILQAILVSESKNQPESVFYLLCLLIQKSVWLSITPELTESFGLKFWMKIASISG